MNTPHSSVTVLDTPEQMKDMQVFTAYKSMKMLVETGMRLTRFATPIYIAELCDLKLPNGKRPKTAKACLKLLTPMKEAIDRKIAERSQKNTVIPQVSDIGTLGTPN